VASYNLRLNASVEKDVAAISEPLHARVVAHIEQLQNDPLPQPSVKLQGAERLYRLRVGDYRIVYELDREARLITIHYIRYRREVYRRLR
jgi:mRNA interferase RelE/StbE